MPVPAISSQERRSSLQRAPHSLQICYTFLSQPSQNSSVQTRAEVFLQLDGEEGKDWPETKHLPFTRSEITSACCLENALSDTF